MIPACRPLECTRGHKNLTESHRMVRVRRDLWGSPSPTPLPKQGHLQQTAQDLVQAGFEYVQRRRIHNLPRQPVPMLHHPQSKEVPLRVQMELPTLQFVPVAHCPVAGHQCLHSKYTPEGTVVSSKESCPHPKTYEIPQ